MRGTSLGSFVVERQLSGLSFSKMSAGLPDARVDPGREARALIERFARALDRAEKPDSPGLLSNSRGLINSGCGRRRFVSFDFSGPK
jgi:hypothetical protein